jgi:iron complex outermembrane receptor protein
LTPAAALGADGPGASGGIAPAGQADAELPAIVVQATPLPGTSIDIDKIPGNVQTLRSSDLTREGPVSLARALGAQLGSASLADNLDDPFQPDLLYRGFEASPVLGTPQGLAVYQNGVRINEAFGGTVNWDLVPEFAIDRVDVVGSNPVYGLNALGGAISVSMKNGFSQRDARAELEAGSFGQKAATLQVGTGSERLGLYAAGRALDEDGWRRSSSDTLRQAFVAASARFDWGSADLSFTHADNRLDGQGAAPVQELAVNRSFVFTGPQETVDRADFLSLAAAADLTAGWSGQAVAYYRQFGQSIANGNTTSYTACTGAGEEGLLCQSDALTPVLASSGSPIPDLSRGGTVPIGENDGEIVHAYGRGIALQASNGRPLWGRDNRLSAGAAFDDASVGFESTAQVGVLDDQLEVQPGFAVATPEGAAWPAEPVGLSVAQRSSGLYATDTFDAAPGLSLTASVRGNLASIGLRDQHGAQLSGDERYRHLNPALGATVRLAQAVTAYAGVSENTRTPTASEIECSDPSKPCLLPSTLSSDPPTLRQVVARTLEAGLRGRGAGPGRQGTLSWNLGMFRTQLDDDIYGVATSLSRGYFQNVGGTRRQGIEAGARYESASWSAYASYSLIDATFRCALALPSPLNAFRDAQGDIQVEPGDRLPGIARQRLRAGLDWHVRADWTVGATASAQSGAYYFGDESNQMGPLPGFVVFGVRAAYQAGRAVQWFANVDNLFDIKYSTYGILGDPTGVGAPGIAAGSVTNGPGVDNRFQSPAAPFAASGGVRIQF